MSELRTPPNERRRATQSAHVDPFCRNALPPRSMWPQMEPAGLPELNYPDRINAAAELLDAMVAAGHGERVAFHHASGSWTYQQLLAASNRIARVLGEDLGIVPGNRVLLRAPNHPMLMACWFGVLKAGAVAVCTNPLLRVRELMEIIEKAQINLALCDARVSADCEQAARSVAATAERPNPQTICFNSESAGALESMMRSKPAALHNCDTSSDDIAIIAFTSGTTGQSKGTMHFHRDLLAVSDTFARHVLRPGPHDIVCGSPSIAFTYGLGGLLLFPLRFGASVMLTEQGSPAKLLHTIQEGRATICFTAPTGYRAMLKLMKDFDLSSLRQCVSAGEHLPRATFDAWRQATGISIIDGIGSTEMLHIFISAAGECIRPGATGRAVPGYEAKIVDDKGVELPPGCVGRLAVRGPTGCRYLSCEREQTKYVQNGWNLTGDSFSMDAKGYFWYQSRTDDMLVCSGYNISAVEVENVLLDHPKVAECAVVGVPDEDRGQIIKAFVVPTAGAGPGDALVKELQEFAKAEIAPYKYPRAIEFVSSLPRNANGKLQRFRLRSQPPLAPSAPSECEMIQPENWPRPSGYANGVIARGRTLFLAGQVGWDPTTGHFESDNFVEQVAQALRNVVVLLQQAGAQPRHLVRLNWYITDKDAYLKSSKEIGKTYREIMGKHFPAMSVVCVSALIENRAQVEIEATAVIPQ
jgi:2-aminobenzoate-CoA ligase